MNDISGRIREEAGKLAASEFALTQLPKDVGNQDGLSLSRIQEKKIKFDIGYSRRMLDIQRTNYSDCEKELERAIAVYRKLGGRDEDLYLPDTTQVHPDQLDLGLNLNYLYKIYRV
jgi:hypothetical protein